MFDLRRPSVLLLLLMPGCLSSGPKANATPGPMDWPVGEFQLRATIQYRRDTGASQSNATEEHWANLTIAPGPEMWMESSTGMCRDPNPQEVERDMARGERRFQCGNALFLLRPAGSTIRADLTVSVTQTTRERAGCIRWEKNTCAEYGYNLRDREVSQRVSMRVQGPGG